jgi:hypothetical protein
MELLDPSDPSAREQYLLDLLKLINKRLDGFNIKIYKNTAFIEKIEMPCKDTYNKQINISIK